MTTYIDPTTGQTIGYQATKGTVADPFKVSMVWQPSSLSYIALSADASGNLAVSGGGGGGGGAVTIADGADITQGGIADSAWSGSGSGTVVSILKKIANAGGAAGIQYSQGTTQATPTGTVAFGKDSTDVLKALALDASGNLNVNLAAGSISGGNAAASLTGSAVPTSADYTGWNSAGNLVGVSLTNALPVQPGTGATFPVSGTFWQATQPVSIASMPSTPVTGTFWQATQPVSGTVNVGTRGWTLNSATDSVTIAGSGGNPAAGATGAAVPASADYQGWNNGGVLVGTSLTNPLPISVNAVNFVYSTNNSSTTQLASQATFTGTIETALNQSAISLLMTADQPMTLTVKQFIDVAGTYAVPPIVFNLSAGQQFSRSFALNGNYIQVVAKNIGSATTTTFDLNTAYGVIDSVDAQGNALTTIYGSNDLAGVSLIESVISGDLAFHVNPINTEKRDANGAQIPSDSPTTQTLVASTVGQVFLIDTQGYQTIGLSMRTMAASVTGSNVLDGTFGSISCFPTVLGAPVTTAAAATNYIIPCLTRYIRLTVTTLGQASYTLRNIPLPALYATNASMNLAQYLGATASSTNPVHVTPLALAATNNQTIPAINVVTSTTPAATVVKATAGKLTMLQISNGAANVAYLHLYNAASVTLGTTVSAMVFAVPAVAGTNISVQLPDGGLFFSTGICYAFTGASASLDNTALTAPSLIANLAFI